MAQSALTVGPSQTELLMPVLDIAFTEPHADGVSKFGHSSTFGADTRAFCSGLLGMAQCLSMEIREQIDSGMRSGPLCCLGKVVAPSVSKLCQLAESLVEVADVGSRSISEDGAIRSTRWTQPRAENRGAGMALSLVQFDAGCGGVTLRAYEHSDRLIVVTRGSGRLSVASNSVDDIAKRGLAGFTGHALEPGDAVLVTRGYVHAVAPDDGGELELLVCHVPFIDPKDDRYMTEAIWHAWASLFEIQTVLSNSRLLTVLHWVNHGVRSSAELCRLLHLSQEALHEIGGELESRRMVTRDEAGGWRVHPTVSLREEDGMLCLAREERGYRVAQKAPRVYS